jgi:hypothetical protein
MCGTVLFVTRQEQPLALSHEDIVEMQQLYAVYSHAIDAGDGPGLAACFTRDGTMDTTVRGVFTGRSEVAKIVSSPETVARHVPVNIVLTSDGADAVGRAYLVVYSGRDGHPSVLATGKYEDRLTREDGAWRFALRRFIPD